MGRKTNRQRRERQAQTAREKAATSRAAQRQREQRRRAVSILGSVVGIAAVIAVIAVVAITHKGSNDTSRPAASPTVLQGVTDVSQATLDKVGKGATINLPKKINDPPLQANGKPELLFVGGEFCPLCAGERWSMIQALSRFGHFSGLKQIRSAVDDGNIATFSFYKSSYTSKYLAFTGVENEDRNQAQLEKLSSSEEAVFKKYTTGYPFLDFGGQYVMTSVGYDVSVLGTSNQQQIASQLNDPSSKVAKAVDGEANVLTAAICKMTNNQPSSACSSSTISGLQGTLGA